MVTTQEVIKDRLRRSLDDAEAHRARLIQASRRVRSLLRKEHGWDHPESIKTAIKTLDNALAFVDRRRRGK